MDASGYLQINDGKIEVTAGGGNENVETVKTEMFGGRGGMMNPQNQVQQTTDEDDDSTSVKGLKADGDIIFCGGTVIVDSADDAVHSNANTYVKGGNLTLSTGDDGIHSDETSEVSGGKVNILTSYEGIEGLNVNITGGEIYVDGSIDNGNSALDSDGEAQISSGTVFAAGSSGMAENFSSNSPSV